ncbi:TetR/AcrR family transcriptional regulator [Kitasatospora paracochleata]|uniref:AcrR family transcriptional regulator n=1 Tax=Kitasatospora paracochleata TaxID=58354 RepID=A0ABT1J2Z8_9ACTN|nr:TetR/AcrR family transcriptional regulator [Kitasatospora paracochleata]MCP2311111.1 AcrR family transcriptional regulator [Kitasatospora paracochleata]
MAMPPSRRAGTSRAGTSRAGTKGVPRADREQQILAAATEEFGLRGYDATSLAAVAARVGVTKTLLHQYFGPKQDLYLACLNAVGDRLLAAIRTAMADGGATGPHTPLRVLHSLFTALEGQREAWFVLYDTSLPPDSEPARRAAHYRAAIDTLAETGSLDVLRRSGPAHSPDADHLGADPLDRDLLAYAWRGLATTLVRWWIRHPDESVDAMTRRCARLFTTARTALAPDPDA